VSCQVLIDGAFGNQGGFFEKPPPWTPRKTFPPCQLPTAIGTFFAGRIAFVWNVNTSKKDFSVVSVQIKNKRFFAHFLCKKTERPVMIFINLAIYVKMAHSVLSTIRTSIFSNQNCWSGSSHIDFWDCI